MCPTVRSGDGEAAGFVAAAEATFRESLGFRPFHGTLNLDDAGEVPPLSGFTPWEADEHCDGIRFATVFVGGVRGAIVRPVVPDYPADRVELVAPVKLRELFGLADGDGIALAEAAWTPDGLRTTVDRLDAFDGVVFGSDALRDDGMTRELVAAASELDCPGGVCTFGPESEAQAALRRSGVEGRFDAVVGRDAVPVDADEGPLGRCLADLGVGSGNAVVVDDDPANAQAAAAIGASFLHPDQLRVEG